MRGPSGRAAQKLHPPDDRPTPDVRLLGNQLARKPRRVVLQRPDDQSGLDVQYPLLPDDRTPPKIQHLHHRTNMQEIRSPLDDRYIGRLTHFKNPTSPRSCRIAGILDSIGRPNPREPPDNWSDPNVRRLASQTDLGRSLCITSPL